MNMTTSETEMLAEITEHMMNVTGEDVAALNEGIKRFTYTASILEALALWDEEHCSDEDATETEGSRMLRRFAREFAAYEATVV